MEPRSFDRGDVAIHPVGYLHHQLQWSRGLLTAETGRTSAPSRTRLPRLQWSRGLLTAETTAKQVRPAGKLQASMEPRSFDRGDTHNAVSAFFR